MSELYLEQNRLIFSGAAGPELAMKVIPWIPDDLLPQVMDFASGLPPDSEFKSRIMANLAARSKPGKDTLIEKRLAAARIDILTAYHLKNRGDPHFLDAIAPVIPLRFLRHVLELAVRTHGGKDAIKALLRRLPVTEKNAILMKARGTRFERGEHRGRSASPRTPAGDD